MGTVYRMCQVCGTLFTIPPSRATTAKYCSTRCSGEGRRAETTLPLDRKVWPHVDATGICWEWTGTMGGQGYGVVSRQKGSRLAHRVVWEMLVGSIPKGMVLDHLCRNRRCVNPDHIEVVTLAENKRRGYSKAAINARKERCKKGHKFDEKSVRSDGRGRRCRICERDNERERQRTIREGR